MIAPVIALLAIAIISLLAVRVGSKALMMTGISSDTASALATLIATLLQSGSGGNTVLMLGGLLGGLLLLLLVSRLAWFDKKLDRLIQLTLERSGMARALDYEMLLRIQLGFVVSEIEITADSYLAGRTLGESSPWDHSVVVLELKSHYPQIW